MITALILMFIYAYGVTGYSVQRWEYCQSRREKWFVGTTWLFWWAPIMLGKLANSAFGSVKDWLNLRWEKKVKSRAEKKRWTRLD